MIKPWHILPLIILGCLSGAAIWWGEQSSSWVPPSPKAPDVPLIADMASPASLKLQAALERPLLWSSRRVKAAATKDTSQIDMLAQARLLSVVQAGGLYVGWVRKKDGALLKITSDSVPWHIESFDGRVAKLLSSDGQRHELAL